LLRGQVKTPPPSGLYREESTHVFAYRRQSQRLIWPQYAPKDVSVAFPARRISAIVGPPGCGKRMLLKSLNRSTASLDPIAAQVGWRMDR